MVVGLPTGGVDWYQDDSGALIWQPGHAATWTDDDGQVYNNVGITANYAQNYINQDGSKTIAHFLGLTDGTSTLLYTTDLAKGTPDGEVTSIGAGFALGGGGSVLNWDMLATGQEKLDGLQTPLLISVLPPDSVLIIVS